MVVVPYHVLLEPIFIHSFSAASHLALFLALSLYSWFHTKVNKYGSIFPYHNQIFWNSMALALFQLVLCVFNYFYFYTNTNTNSWSHEIIAIQLDFVLIIIPWFAISYYFYSSTPLNIPIFLRVWWVFFFFLSCYCLALDIDHQNILTHLWIKDGVSFVMGFFFLYVGVFRKNEGDQVLLQQPLLNDGGRNLGSPFSDAGILSVLTFSWLNPMLARGNNKTLDLEDVPQLDCGDTVDAIYPILNHKVYSSGSSGSNNEQVSTIKLVKALLLTTWREVLVTGLLCFLYTISSYVGPYLIDTLVQYLSGRREFNSEGYVLVSSFFITKLVEGFSQRKWFFRLQQVGLRIRAALIATIYTKGQNLSSRSKQSHTSGEIINLIAVDTERIGHFSWFLHDTWIVPVQVILALLILYKNLGLASVAAFVTTVLVMFANFPLGMLEENFQEKLMESKDGRMKRTSEMLKYNPK